MRRPRAPWHSSIATRLAAFNLLLVFLPVAAFLALDTYERQLLRALEHALVQQARLLASALSGAPALEPREAERVLEQMAQRQEARLRVVDTSGVLVADSSRVPEPVVETVTGTEAGVSRTAEAASAPLASERPLYWLATLPVRLYRRTLQPPQPPLESSEFYAGATVLTGSEIQEALQGRYGSATRISSGGQRSVTLYSAIPVLAGTPDQADPRLVLGAVLASQSTYRILQDLYELRLQVFRIFLLSVAGALVLSLLVSATITRPIARLSATSRAVLDHRGRIAGHIHAYRRRDEIGELSRALEELTHNQEQHLRILESLAADLAHELRNPLAAIRSAAEMASQARGPAESRRFHEMIRRDVARVERLLAGVREISRIDAHLVEEERLRVDALHVVGEVLDVLRMRGTPAEVDYRLEGETGVLVETSPDRLVQVMEKLLENAASYTPSGGAVEVTVGRDGADAVIRVQDRGPGVPSELRERIFERFFTWRPGQTDEEHSGLGLAVAKAIVEGYGGGLTASAREGGGACFELRLPAAS